MFIILINILLVPLYLKYLTVEEYGLITFFANLTSAFVILDMGLGLTVNKEVAASEAKENSQKKTGDIIRSFELVYWLMALIIGIFLFLFSKWISINWLNVKYISIDQLTLIISLMGLALVFRWPISFYENILSGFQKMVSLNFIKIIISAINLSFCYVLFNFYNLKIKGYFIFIALIFFTHICLLLFTVWSKKKLSFIKSKFFLRILLKSKSYIFGIGLYSIIGTLYVIIDKIIISKYFLTEELAYYSLVSMACLSLF